MIEEIVRNWWHIPVLMVAIFVYAWFLNRVLFAPVQRILDERKKSIHGAAALSERSREALKSRMAEYEQAVLEAHRRGTQIKEQARNKALAYRASILDEVKNEVGRELEESEAKLKDNVGEVKEALAKEIPDFSRTLAAKILGREVAS